MARSLPHSAVALDQLATKSLASRKTTAAASEYPSEYVSGYSSGHTAGQREAMLERASRRMAPVLKTYCQVGWGCCVIQRMGHGERILRIIVMRVMIHLHELNQL